MKQTDTSEFTAEKLQGLMRFCGDLEGVFRGSATQFVAWAATPISS